MELKVYSKLRQKMETLLLLHTETGWQISFMERQEDCDPTGAPMLYDVLVQEKIGYPGFVPEKMQQLWELAQSLKLNEDEIQVHLDQVASYIQMHNIVRAL